MYTLKDHIHRTVSLISLLKFRIRFYLRRYSSRRTKPNCFKSHRMSFTFVDYVVRFFLCIKDLPWRLLLFSVVLCRDNDRLAVKVPSWTFLWLLSSHNPLALCYISLPSWLCYGCDPLLYGIQPLPDLFSNQTSRDFNGSSPKVASDPTFSNLLPT